MTRINLLPWREEKREQEKKMFVSMLAASGMLSVVIVFLINCYATDLVSNQITRNQKLQQEITAYDNQLKEIKALDKVKSMLIARMSIVRNLQATRTMMVHLFDELVKVMPTGVFLTKIEGKNTVVTVLGYSESNTYVSQIMKNIEHNDWIHNPALSEIKRMDDKKQAADNVFKLTFVLEPEHQLGVK